MQFGHSHEVAAQGGDLADHVHAARVLVFVGQGDEARGIRRDHGGGRARGAVVRLAGVHGELAAAVTGNPVESLGGDPQPADVHPFESRDDILARFPLVQQAALLALEHLEVGSLDATDGMTRAGL